VKPQSKSYILVAFLALTLPFSLHSQAASPDANPGSAVPVASPQAPDEATRKITDLVHAGKYSEAQKLTEGLLIAYPNDQRLIKAKALIEKLLAPGGSDSAAPASNQPTQPTSDASARQLSGMDKVEYNTLLELARQAQQQTDSEQQRASLMQFMGRSSAFLQKHPEQMLLWQLRAASAIGLNDAMAGYEAGQRLIASGAADSTDPNLQRLMAQLNSRGWLDKQKAEDDSRYGGVLGTWKVACSSDGTPDNDGNEIVFVKSDAGHIEGYFLFKSAGHKESTPLMRGAIGASGEISWELYLHTIANKDGKVLDTEEPGGRYFEFNSIPGKALYPSGWQPPIDYVISPDKRAMTMKWPLQTANVKKNADYISQHPVIWTFEKVSD
jgi:hypothetical protein